MTVLTIRAHKRYAVRQPVRVAKPGEKAVGGLMIELSSEGCRISNVGRSGFAIGEAVTLEIEELAYTGHVRWSHDGIVGVRLAKPLYNSELCSLVARGRGEIDVQDLRYGT
jgi:hypothetical protein